MAAGATRRECRRSRKARQRALRSNAHLRQLLRRHRAQPRSRARVLQQSVGSLEARVLVTARKFKERGALAGEEIETIEPVDKSARTLSLDEGGLFPELVAAEV